MNRHSIIVQSCKARDWKLTITKANDRKNHKVDPTKIAATHTVVVRTPHPFTRLNNPSRWEIIRMILGLVTLIAPLRLVLLVVSLAVVGSVTLLFHSCNVSYGTVLSLRYGCRWILFVAGYYWIDVEGTIPSPCPKIIVSNHISNMEILHLLSLPFQDEEGNPVLPAFVTKESIFQLPFVGRITKDVLWSIGVTRRQNQSSQQQQQQPASDTVTDKILERCRDQNHPHLGPLVIFPEGTTTNGTCLLPFKKGAFAPMVHVLPVLYSLSNNQQQTFVPSYESIWGPAYLWRLLCSPKQTMRCQLLEPISPPLYHPSIPNPPIIEFAGMVRSLMAAHSNLPMLSDKYTYRHKVKYHEQLRKVYQSHPLGSIYAMCFEPVQKVLTQLHGEDECNSENDSKEYDAVLGRCIYKNKFECQ